MKATPKRGARRAGYAERLHNKEYPAVSNRTHSRLKEKQRSIRAGFSPEVGLRVHRALSWLQRAEQANTDLDIAYICYWIAFNAAYADEVRESDNETERALFDEFFRKLTKMDRDSSIYNAIWERYPSEIRALLDNRYVFAPFWKHYNGVPENADWQDRFDRSKRRIAVALSSKDTHTILGTLFDRLYVLRNQLVHGGATWNSSVNRTQIRDGTRILALLVPIFVELIMDNPLESWGAPYYPVID